MIASSSSEDALPSEGSARLKNVVVLGASYAGARAAELLAKSLPPTHRLVLIERRTHFAHIYVWPRFATYDGHAHKSFVPFSEFLERAKSLDDTCPEPEEKRRVQFADSVIVHAHVVGISPTHVMLDQDMCMIPSITEDCFEENGEIKPASQTIDQGKLCCGGNACCMPERRCRGRAVPYDYLVYALGATLPHPLFSEARTKPAGVAFLQARHEAIRDARRILIVGGGALGIQFATDIADTFPEKHVMLVHSRPRLMPIFDQRLHDAALERMDELGIEVLLGERVIYPAQEDEGGEMAIRTESGRKIMSDMRIWATGQKPNSWLMSKFAPHCIDKEGFIKVRRTLQLHDTAYPHVFAIGDCIDGFGAIKAGHTGWNQAGIAANNIVKMARAENDGTPLTLEEYFATLPMIRLTLGLRQSISQVLSPEGQLEVTEQTDLPPETSWRHIWDMMGVDHEDPCI